MKKIKLTSLGLTLALMGAVAACTGPAKATKETPASPVSAEEPGKTPAQAPSLLSGKVFETMNAGGYTYIGLENNGQKTWAAVPMMKVEVGQQMTLMPGGEISNFTSKALNRTFDKIIFSGGPAGDKQAAANGQPMPSNHPALPTASAQPAAAAPQGGPIKTTSDVILYQGKVVETMNAGAYTYLCLEKEGKKGWAAVPHVEVKVGQEVELQPGQEMGTFTSKNLNRVFNNILFSSGIVTK